MREQASKWLTRRSRLPSDSTSDARVCKAWQMIRDFGDVYWATQTPNPGKHWVTCPLTLRFIPTVKVYVACWEDALYLLQCSAFSCTVFGEVTGFTDFAGRKDLLRGGRKITSRFSVTVHGLWERIPENHRTGLEKPSDDADRHDADRHGWILPRSAFYPRHPRVFLFFLWTGTFFGEAE